MCAPASRAFSRTAMASGSPPFCFWSCASRNAADMPAGPPPTIRTSTSSVSRSTGLFLQLGYHRRHDLEEIAGYPEVGNLEDRRLGILVDRHDRPRSLHADEVLNRSGNAEGNIELWRNGLPRAPNLAIHRQPAGIADRTRGGNLGTHRLRELLDELQMFLALDATAHGNDSLGLREID